MAIRSSPSSCSGVLSWSSSTTSLTPRSLQSHSKSSKPKRHSRSLEATIRTDTRPSRIHPRTRNSPRLLKLIPEPTSDTSSTVEPDWRDARWPRRCCFCRSRSSTCFLLLTLLYSTVIPSGFLTSPASRCCLPARMLSTSKSLWPAGVLSALMRPALSQFRRVLTHTPSLLAASLVRSIASHNYSWYGN